MEILFYYMGYSEVEDVFRLARCERKHFLTGLSGYDLYSIYSLLIKLLYYILIDLITQK